MKTHNIILLLLIASLSFMGCGKKKIEQLEQTQATLVAEQTVRDSLLNDFASSFEAFESNLAEIREREQIIITPQENERKAESKERIISDLNAIDELLNSNKEIISDLNDQVEKNQGKANQVRRMVNGLKKKLAAKDEEITSLKDNLEKANYEVSELTQTLESLETSIASYTAQRTEQVARLTTQKDILDTQTEQIEQQISELYTAYMAMGTSKELRQKKIISKKGSFLGIGGKMVVEKEVSEGDFTKIDISSTTNIPLEAKKASLASYHPTSSYTIVEEDGKVTGIEIIKPEEFWKISKYLVVVLN